MRRAILSLSILFVALAFLTTACGGPKGPSAQISASAKPTADGGVEYPEQNLTFRTKEDNVLPLRVHLFDKYCKSTRASIEVKSIHDPAAAQDLKTSKVIELDFDMYAWACDHGEANLDVKLVPGKYVLVVDYVEQDVKITVLPHKS